VQFSLNGVIVRRALRRDGKSQPPTPMRQRAATQLSGEFVFVDSRYATMMLMAGMTPAFCAAQLGHSVGMLLETYAARAREVTGETGAGDLSRTHRSTNLSC
jgi:hypothetical protein